MDITDLKYNSKYYDGFEGEPEINLTILDNPEISLSIWEGYFSTIFQNPKLGVIWTGFTRDYQQDLGAFDIKLPKVYLQPQEYLEDIIQYKNKTFKFPEVKEVINLIIKFLQYAIEINSLFTMEVM